MSAAVVSVCVCCYYWTPIPKIDICCGTGTIGLYLSKVGTLAHIDILYTHTRAHTHMSTAMYALLPIALCVCVCANL